MKIDRSVKNTLPFTNSELAVKLAAQGWLIFPCRADDKAKQPYIKGGFKQASSDPQQVAKWWRKWPNALIGFPPGPNGLLVIDQDVKGGVDGVAAWRKLSGAWKDAIATETPSGGLHDWFQGPTRTIGNGRGQLPKGIDVRCDHGYVCLGTLADGTCYAPDGEPDLYQVLLKAAPHDFVPLPAAVLEMLPSGDERKTSESNYRDPLKLAWSLDYKPISLKDLYEASHSLDGWSAPEGDGRSNSDDAFDWLTKAVVALCQATERDAEELTGDDARTLAELTVEADHDFMAHYDERGMGKLGYDIDRAFEWARKEGIRSDAKAMQDFDRLAAQFAQTGQTRAESGDTGDRTADEAAGFLDLLEALSEAGPDELLLDLKLRELAALPGAPGITALRKQYAALKREKRRAGSKDGTAFPDEMPMTGAPRANSLSNIEAWLDGSGLDIWFDEWAEVVRIGDRVFDDHDLRRITRDMHADKLFADRMVKQGVDTFAFERRAHPVKEWMEDAAEKWDGAERLDFWLEDYCGAPGNDAWRAVSRLVLIAVVGRVFCPGVKWDSVLTFIGDQGFNKSTACRVLAIRDEWYLEGFKLKWSMKEVIENTEGKLIWEYAEFSGHKAADQDELKDAVTRTVDKARKAYGQYAVERRRQGVIIGTSNEDTPLHDTTGNRRYWPLKLAGPIDTKGLRAELVQLYGEAVHAWRAGEASYQREGILLPREHWEYFGTLQEDARMKVSMEEQLEDDMRDFTEGHIAAVTLRKLLDIRVNDRYAGRDISRIMERLGWDRTRKRFGKDANPRAYFTKGAQPERTAIVCVDGMDGRKLHSKKLR